MEKIRLDKLLVDREMVESREQAQRLILAGQVEVEGKVVTKAGTRVAASASLRLLAPAEKYVSRGGLKLEAALARTGIDVRGKIALDIGASTGGFTDCLLQHGARKVYAVDVGYGQLHWRLRQDERVVSLERINARYLTREIVPDPPDVVTIDVSFISLEKILPAVSALVRPGAHILCLVKPQFEAGRRDVPRGGVVRDARVHRRVLQRLIKFCQKSNLAVLDVFPSPLLGSSGNREFFLSLRLMQDSTNAAEQAVSTAPRIDLDTVVAQRSLS
jgi:23S rRNA (cytidine1920-2'-O)/16S rRNA (cytidine1409-2'-O)-methyltransferase